MQFMLTLVVAAVVSYFVGMFVSPSVVFLGALGHGSWGWPLVSVAAACLLWMLNLTPRNRMIASIAAAVLWVLAGLFLHTGWVVSLLGSVVVGFLVTALSLHMWPLATPLGISKPRVT